jgi:hypothetical protein
MDSDDGVRGLAELLASRADHPSVTADRLAGSSDAAADLESPVVTHLVEGERPRYCFESHADGVGLGDPDATADPERGGVFLFTDLRAYLLLGLADGDRSLSLPYESIASVDFYQEMSRHRIELAAEGTTYHLWIPASFDREAVSRAVEYATYRRKQEMPDRGSEVPESESGDDSDAPQSVHERLERLGDAKSRGLIDEEEFQHRKEELLDE